MATMPSEIAFSWRAGTLEWMVVLEIVVLLTMAAFRYVAGLLGRSDPTDPFVIFYRVFWQALYHPRHYPVPVNYRPVPPRREKKAVRPEGEEMTGGLTDEELEAIMRGDADESPGPSAAPPPGRRAAPARRSPVDEPDSGTGGTVQSTLEVQVVAGPLPQVLRFDGSTLVIQVNVPPDDGRANAIVIRHVCNMLRLETHQVAIAHGHTKPEKSLRISGMSAAALADRVDDLTPRLAPDAPVRAKTSDQDDAITFRDD